uniref:Uncharacterized protein n=1 Tax=Sphaerodactylus townsendi TaxID=933632 RepID=A0ACB8GE78_9SAUR
MKPPAEDRNANGIRPSSSDPDEAGGFPKVNQDSLGHRGLPDPMEWKASQDCQGTKVTKEKEANQEYLDPREKWDKEESLDFRVQMVFLAIRVKQDLGGNPAMTVAMGPREMRASREAPGVQAFRVSLQLTAKPLGRHGKGQEKGKAKEMVPLSDSLMASGQLEVMEP